MKLCMGCMEEIEDNVTTCPYCGYDETTLQQEAYYLKPGTVIGGKYILGRVIKYTGYVIKYMGMDAENNRKITITEYLPSDYSSRSAGENRVTIYSGDALTQFDQGLLTFLNEGNKIQQLGAVRGIAQIYDCIADNDTGYYISEYQRGFTLQEVLDKGKVFTPMEAKAVITELLLGLQQIHLQGIIHCDIAPENIFITNDGVPKLLDFGSAKYITTSNSKSLAIILKQGYAPEEQYRSQGERDASTDVYALAAVMYRMITGKIPMESIDRTLEDRLEEPSKIVPEIPKSMENALMNALNVYQKERTASAEEFYKELNSSETKRIKVKQKKRENGRMPLWIKSLVAVVVCAIFAGSAILYHSYQKEQELKLAGKVDEKFSTGLNKSYAAFLKNWEKYGFSENSVEVEYRYDNSVTEDTVKEFEDHTETGCLVDGTAIKTIKKDEKVKEDAVFAKVIVASADKYTFLSEWGSNAPAVAEENTEVTYEQKRFFGSIVLTEDATKPFGVVKSISVDGKKISPENITEPLYVRDCDNNKKNEVAISIYVGSYYVMGANREHKTSYYQGRRVSDVLFKYGNKGTGWTSKKLDSSKYDNNYISFEKNTGTIVDVLSKDLAAGNKYDGSKNIGEKLFDTVAVRMNYGECTVSDLRALHCRIKGNEKYRSDDIIIWSSQKTFKRNEEITIKTKSKPTPTPVPAPVQKSTPAPTEKQIFPEDTPTKKPAGSYDDNSHSSFN